MASVTPIDRDKLTISVEQQLRARARQQEVVAELGHIALAGADIDELMDRAVRAVSEVLDNEFVKILEVIPGTDRLLLRAGVGWREGLVGHATVGIDNDSQAGYTLRSDEPVIVRDLRFDKRFRGPRLLREHGVVSGMSVAITGRERHYGALGTHSRRLREFTRDDINFLTAVANVLAAAIDRRSTESELVHRQQQLAVAQQVTGVAVWEWDLNSDYVKWAMGSAEVYGVSFENVNTVQRWAQLVHPDDIDRVWNALQQSIARDSDYDIEYRTTWPDGSTHWLMARGKVARDVSGNPERMIGVNMDITSRKRAEEVLQRSEKLAMVGRLAATIAHEINNPLEAVTNLLYLIEHHTEIDDAGKSYARIAQQELGRVTHIARQTLGFSRESVRSVPGDVSELVESVVKLYERQIERKKVIVERKYRQSPEIPLFSAEMRQVISNLLMNSLDAVPDGGLIRIHVKPGLEFGAKRRGVRILFSDNGPGISRTIRRRIFEPFFTTKGDKGTGLGLWVTHGIVHKHGGTIRVFSSVDPLRHGTTFSIFLPETTPLREGEAENAA